MSATQYMNWDHRNWKLSQYTTTEQKILHEDNIKKIDEIAELMMRSEVKDFISNNYGMEVETSLF